MAMLNYISEFNVPGMSSRFKIRNIEFSSVIAALQSIALIWNIGHLPGTFSVEKGIYRYLFETNINNPVQNLIWPNKFTNYIEEVKKYSNRLLKSIDYMGLSRVLAMIKLYSLSDDESDFIFNFTEHFAKPFFYNSILQNESKWNKLIRSFNLIRHLAYLTLDVPYTGLPFSSWIPAFFKQLLNTSNCTLSRIEEQICEVLSPVERMTFDLIYHSSEARIESLLIADITYLKLIRLQRPSVEINRWLKCGFFKDLQLNKIKKGQHLKRIASIRFRSHFASWFDSPIKIETELRKKGFTYPAVYEYKSWNTDKLLEPNDKIIDILTKNNAKPENIGKLILCIMEKIDSIDAKIEDDFQMIVKNDIEASYIQLLSRAIDLCFENVQLDVEPWPLKKWGYFPSVSIAEGKGIIWASNSKMDDNYAKHIMRDKSRSIKREYKEKYSELRGIAAINKSLRRNWSNKNRFQRWLIVTASLRFCKDSIKLIEFDGGLVRIAVRSGNITWYGLETKSRSKSPTEVLKSKIGNLKLPGRVYTLSHRHAYVEIPLKPFRIND